MAHRQDVFYKLQLFAVCCTMPPMRATKAIIHLDNLNYNITQIKQTLAPETKICLPVKADAYGHGAVRTAIAAIRAGVSYLAVASVQEGIELREAGIVAPIISLSLPILEEIDSIIDYKLEPLVIDEEFINELNRAADAQKKTVAVHLKIDTGMSRIGCKPSEAVKLATQIVRAKNLRLQGVATHFAVADSDSKSDRAFTKDQLERFSDAVEAIRQTGIHIPLVHAANSGAVQMMPEARFDMVRPGLLAYGYLPLQDTATAIDVNTRGYLRFLRAQLDSSSGYLYCNPPDRICRRLTPRAFARTKSTHRQRILPDYRQNMYGSMHG